MENDYVNSIFFIIKENYVVFLLRKIKGIYSCESIGGLLL